MRKIDEMDAALFGSFKRARAELGVESFGMQVIDLPPSFDGYPSHDHTHDDQEEVYIALRGAGELEVEGERIPLDEDHMARVGPTEKRKVFSGPEGIRMLIVGGIPGRPYAAPETTEIGGPDPKMPGRS
ncbi:MAG: hypothetical protein JST59_04285 [Actinobacteria bacterium]|nr:hypothetical protein [Actinomycetota bacterium]